MRRYHGRNFAQAPVFLSPDAPSDSTDRPAASHWQIRLLGGLEARRGDETITNFASRGVAALLARLAIFPKRSHAREELIELLWPGVALSSDRRWNRPARTAS